MQKPYDGASILKLFKDLPRNAIAFKTHTGREIKFKVFHGAGETWARQGELEVQKLLATGYLYPTASPMATTYLSLQLHNNHLAFMGQMDAHGSPDGIVRVLYQDGGIYEGQMTSDGQRDGFGRHIQDNGVSKIGWWRKGVIHGNFYSFYRDGGLMAQGWQE